MNKVKFIIKSLIDENTELLFLFLIVWCLLGVAFFPWVPFPNNVDWVLGYVIKFWVMFIGTVFFLCGIWVIYFSMKYVLYIWNKVKILSSQYDKNQRSVKGKNVL